jgi:hypothetical protein
VWQHHELAQPLEQQQPDGVHQQWWLCKQRSSASSVCSAFRTAHSDTVQLESNQGKVAQTMPQQQQ